MEIKRNDIFLIAFGLVMLILISCKPKPEVSFDVDSFHKSLEEIASGVIEWTSDLEEEQKDTLNVGDKFECDRALSDSVVLREMKGYLGNDDIDSTHFLKFLCIRKGIKEAINPDTKHFS